MGFQFVASRIDKNITLLSASFVKMEVMVIQINSFHDFEKLIQNSSKKNKLRLFRGQRSDWSLHSNLYRFVLKDRRQSEFYDIEERLINQFKKNVIKAGFRQETQNDWDTLSLAQHYGLPTRFLDWSENPYIALWFACVSEKLSKTNSIVWGLAVDDDCIADPQHDSPFDQRFIKVFKPNPIDILIRVQQSWFSVQDINFFNSLGDGLPHLDRNEPLEINEEFEFSLIKIVVPNRIRSEIIKRLDKMGISRSTLFPDLKTICDKIKSKEFNKLENRIQKRKL